jgi:hypothetical protein
MIGKFSWISLEQIELLISAGIQAGLWSSVCIEYQASDGIDSLLIKSLLRQGSYYFISTSKAPAFYDENDSYFFRFLTLIMLS